MVFPRRVSSRRRRQWPLIYFLLPRFKGQWWDADQRAAARQASFSETE